MGNAEIREPIQKRSIEKKEKIIQAGFGLICQKGYYNTTTSEIAKSAGVSIGILYQYFKDKHDILIDGFKLYSNSIFFPMLQITDKNRNLTITNSNIPCVLKDMVNKFIRDHKISQTAHEEIIAMIHSDKEVAEIYHNSEMEMTNKIVQLLLESGITVDNINEKVHVAIGMIDNLCHEIVYHKHKQLDYDKMIDIVISSICNMII
nr:TetR/AcrR family transcriptional regulator [Clostridia bacterium]